MCSSEPALYRSGTTGGKVGKNFYRFVRGIIRTFTRPMKIEWETPFSGGPCVFVPNHLGAAGPIAMCAHFPLIDVCHPWINAPVMDRKQMPDYVRTDLWWNHDSVFHPLLNALVPPLAAALVPPVMNGAGGVPVYRDMSVLKTFRTSIDILKKGENLIIFPEKMSGYGEYNAEMNTGWLFLADMWYKATGKPLAMYPVFINTKERLFHVAAPILWDPSRTLKDQTDEIIGKVKQAICR